MARAPLPIVFAWLTLSACGPSAPPQSAAQAMLGKPIELTLPSDTGQLSSLPAPDAQVTVADFFAPTCAPCRA